MSAEEVIDAWIDPCGSDTGAGILSALKAAGYAVVQLPEPVIDQRDHINGGLSDYHEFSDGSDEGTVGAYPGSGLIYSATGWEWTPDGARAVAAKLARCR